MIRKLSNISLGSYTFLRRKKQTIESLLLWHLCARYYFPSKLAFPSDWRIQRGWTIWEEREGESITSSRVFVLLSLTSHHHDDEPLYSDSRGHRKLLFEHLWESFLLPYYTRYCGYIITFSIETSFVVQQLLSNLLNSKTI